MMICKHLESDQTLIRNTGSQVLNVQKKQPK